MSLVTLMRIWLLRLLSRLVRVLLRLRRGRWLIGFLLRLRRCGGLLRGLLRSRLRRLCGLARRGRRGFRRRVGRCGRAAVPRVIDRRFVSGRDAVPRVIDRWFLGGRGAVPRMIHRRHRRIGNAWPQRRGWARETTDRRIGVRRMRRRRAHRRWRARGEEKERDRLHDFPIAHVPDAKCCVCMRSSAWIFAMSAGPTMKSIFAPPSTSDAVAFECTPIIPPACPA
jgi:hypothetical protein